MSVTNLPPDSEGLDIPVTRTLHEVVSDEELAVAAKSAMDMSMALINQDQTVVMLALQKVILGFFIYARSLYPDKYDLTTGGMIALALEADAMAEYYVSILPDDIIREAREDDLEDMLNNMGIKFPDDGKGEDS